MFKTCKPLFLASSSPRRQRLLNRLGLVFTVLPADIDETPHSEEPPVDFVLRMAHAKAEAIAKQHPQAFVLGADTVVTVNNQIIGKPRTPESALLSLMNLQGKTHQVVTGVSIICLQKSCSTTFSQKTKVQFNIFSKKILQAYVDTGEPMDKAGGYGLQAKGGFLVDKIEGSYTNAIGLPVSICIRMLLKYNVITPQ